MRNIEQTAPFINNLADFLFSIQTASLFCNFYPKACVCVYVISLKKGVPTSSNVSFEKRFQQRTCPTVLANSFWFGK
jgi:hypothetical protein